MQTETQTKTEGGRPWTWTPSPFMNQFMSTVLRLPLIHRVLSGMMLLITFTGRKSGKQYTTPVGYLHEGNTVTIMTKRFRTWWHNFEQPASVTLRMAGQEVSGTAVAITNPDELVSIITHIISVRPREAQIYEIPLVDGQPAMDSVRALTPKVVVIRVTLASV